MSLEPVPGLDFPRLTRWLADALPDAGALTGAKLIAGGRSNLTYRLDFADKSVALRRQPLGHVLPTAHDMVREHKVLSALTAAGGVPVPAPLGLCTDKEVLGADFYVMEWVDGLILRVPEDARDVAPEQRAAVSDRLAEALAAIHTLDVDKAGLGDFGRPEGYMARQLKRWGQQWERSKTRELPSYDRLVERLAAGLPDNPRSGLVHGDFRLDNALVRLTPEPAVAAVVDWEMSTLGDPLADLGLTLVYWAEADEAQLPVGSTITAEPGFPTRAQFTEKYASLTGFDVSDLDYYVAFGCFKLAVILEGIHARFVKGQTVGEGFDQIGAGVPVLLDRAHEVLG
ncbi:aminoglycoside phosphotransferase (APT) family kinase protein [Actinocorallia herbida]|uniref:Aminoglycoside phosphotransferase (APT) family kinase protein n=1 Tax=Actinocorallia herbida TaxID=58109 RepID=A0A3N1D7U1_9ACTN|nr:phosphotransferase family protein [Actinocorallia herbida]ROO89590.1 aminoglycoside phosphotransferase (APT) family kinase protein [Actinocorallia herbida]